MKILKMLAYAVVLPVVLSGCTELLTYNAFDGLGAPELPESASAIQILSDDEFFRELDSLIGSAVFYQHLIDQDAAAGSADDSIKAVILSRLTTKMSDLLDLKNAHVELTEEQVDELRTSAVMTGDIILNTTDVGERVNNVANSATEILSGDLSEITVESVAESMINAFNDVENSTALSSLHRNVSIKVANDTDPGFVAARESLHQAAEAYWILADSLDSDGDGDYDQDDRKADNAVHGSVVSAIIVIAIDTFMIVGEEVLGEPVDSSDDMHQLLYDSSNYTEAYQLAENLLLDRSAPTYRPGYRYLLKEYGLSDSSYSIF